MPDLEVWMRVGQPLEPVLADQERILDAWQSGGVRGLVIGRLTFLPNYPDRPPAAPGTGDGAAPGRAPAPPPDRGTGPAPADPAAPPAPPAPPRVASWGGHRADAVWAYAPNPTVYRRWDVPPPPEPPKTFPERRRQLDQLIDNAKRRNWQVYLFEPAAGYTAEAAEGGGKRALLWDERRRRAYLARLEDALTQFPQVDGVILDGPEWGYEIAPGHRSNMFDDLPPEAAPAARALGFDYERLAAARDRLGQRLHKLSREQATLGAAGGVFTGLSLIGNDPGVAAWFAFRARTLTAFYRQVQQLTDALTRARGRQVKLGVGPRLPFFSALCGYDFPAIAPLFDLILPKLYIWHRGVDGLYGTVYRYVATLADWNPGLWEPEAFAALKALLGIALPSAEPGAAAGEPMKGLRELERGFPDRFFAEVMAGEVRRAIAAADGYPWKVLPWVDAGRRPHGGDPVTAHDLRRLLGAMKDGGARHFLYHNHGHLTAAEWAVISEVCGAAWRAGEGLYGKSYAPPDG
jgi:hypothetical protein